MLDRLGKIQDTLTEIKVTQARQEENLREHMKRWEASETRITQVENFISEKLQPHLSFISISLKICAFIAAVIGVVGTFVKLLEIFQR